MNGMGTEVENEERKQIRKEEEGNEEVKC